MGRQPRLIFALLLLPALLAGCSGGEDTSMTKDEKDNFKGGPMPADFSSKPGASPANGPPK